MNQTNYSQPTILHSRGLPAVSTSVSSSLQNNAWLNLHNDARKNAGVGPLVWNDNLANDAQNYANKCIFKHSDVAQNGYVGENISQGVPANKYNSINTIFTGWMSERNNCPSSDPYKIGHYTQVINPRVTQVGCGCTLCDRTSGLNPENDGIICVCRYDQIQNLNEIHCQDYYQEIPSDAIPLKG